MRNAGHRLRHLPGRRIVLWMALVMGAFVALTLAWGAGTMSSPEVDAYNVRVGTQTFAPLYQFSTNTELVETALAIQEMGSDIIKFALGLGVTRQYGIALPASITNLLSEAKNEPSCRRVLDMPFRHQIIWA